MSYSKTIQIEFNHCDPAGIVFYPRYFEMTNSTVENFFADELEYSFARMTVEEGHGVPTVSLHCEFRAPSRLGEKVVFTLEVERVGRSSVGFRITARKGEEVRLTADLTLVWVDRNGRPAPWPDGVRARLMQHLNQGDGDDRQSA